MPTPAVTSSSPINVVHSCCSPAATPGGCTEAVMLAHGFTFQQLAELVREGFAAATTERVGGGGQLEVGRFKITEAGLRTLGGQR